MQLSLVLGEEEKKERFKVSIEKRKRDAKVSIQHPIISSENSLPEVFLDQTNIPPAISSCQTFKHFPPVKFARYDHRPIVAVAPMPNFSSQPLTTSSPIPIYSTQHAVMSTKLDKRELPICNTFVHSPSINPSTSFFSSEHENVWKHSTFHQNRLNCSGNLFSQSFIENKLQTAELKEKEERKINFPNAHADTRKSVIQITSEAKYEASELNQTNNHDDSIYFESDDADADKQLIMKYTSNKFAEKKQACLADIKLDIGEETLTNSSGSVNRYAPFLNTYMVCWT